MPRTRIRTDQEQDIDFLSESELNEFFGKVVITGTLAEDQDNEEATQDTVILETFDSFFPGRGLVTVDGLLTVTTGTTGVTISGINIVGADGTEVTTSGNTVVVASSGSVTKNRDLFHAYDSTGNLAINTDTVITFDTEVVKDISSFTFTAGGSEITFAQSGTYEITYDISTYAATGGTGGAQRSAARSRLQENRAGGGFVNVDGSWAYHYVRGSVHGTHGSSTIVREYSTGDIIRLVCSQTSGSGAVATFPGSPNITIRDAKASGQKGPPGGTGDAIVGEGSVTVISGAGTVTVSGAATQVEGFPTSSGQILYGHEDDGGIAFEDTFVYREQNNALMMGVNATSAYTGISPIPLFGVLAAQAVFNASTNPIVNVVIGKHEAFFTTIGANIYFKKSRGSEGSPSAVLNTDVLSNIWSAGWDGEKYMVSTVITSTVDGPTAADQVPSRMDFIATNPAGLFSTTLSVAGSGVVTTTGTFVGDQAHLASNLTVSGIPVVLDPGVTSITTSGVTMEDDIILQGTSGISLHPSGQIIVISGAGVTKIITVSGIEGDITFEGAGEVDIITEGNTVIISGTPHTAGAGETVPDAIVGGENVTVVSGASTTTISALNTVSDAIVGGENVTVISGTDTTTISSIDTVSDAIIGGVGITVTSGTASTTIDGHLRYTRDENDAIIGGQGATVASGSNTITIDTFDETDVDSITTSGVTFTGSVNLATTGGSSIIPNAGSNTITISGGRSVGELIGNFFQIEFTANGVVINEWMSISEGNLNSDQTPWLVVFPSRVAATAFSNANDDVDVDIEIHVAPSGSGNSNTIAYTWEIRAARTAYKSDFGLTDIELNPGDKVGVFASDAGGNASDAFVGLYVEIRETSTEESSEDWTGDFS